MKVLQQLHRRSMSGPTVFRLAWTVAILATVLVLLTEIFFHFGPGAGLPSSFWPVLYDVLLPLVVISFGGIGALVISRESRNWIGWICVAIGLAVSLTGALVVYSLAATFNPSAGLPAGRWTTWVVQWTWLVINGFIFVFLPVLFPNGRLLSRAWRGVIWLSLVALFLDGAAAVVYPTMGLGTVGPSCVWSAAIPGPCYHIASPFPITLPRLVLDPIVSLGGYLESVAVVLAVLSLLVRFQKGSFEVRAQLKWLVSAFGLLGVTVVALFISGNVLRLTTPALWILAAVAVMAVPVAIGFAILKYHLYDIDIVINRSLVFGGLAVFITAVYVGIVAGVGALIGTRGRPSLALSIVATAVVAVAFQPVLEIVERFANRLVYGKRATPYEVLSHFTERVGGTYASEEILPRMAQVLAEGTGAARADVWLRLGERIAPTASWPASDGLTPASVPLSGQLLPQIPSVTRILPVRHHGELLGALSISKRPGEALTPVEDELLRDLAAQAGLVLRNVRLTAELRARLDEISRQASELRASRQRIVATQDAERRRLERNIHDGAQQNLVALTVKLRLAASLAKRDPEMARGSVMSLVGESDQALETLRALAQGIYPPLLRKQGLVAAVRAEAEKLAVIVTVQADELRRRFAPDVEAAVYFVCLEALQNVAKHARASRVTIKLDSNDQQLVFEITDDGTGFQVDGDREGSGLRNMADRMEAVGGRLDIQSTTRGTTVHGVVPLPAMEPVG